MKCQECKSGSLQKWALLQLLKKNKKQNRIPTLLPHHLRKGRKEFIERRQEGEGERKKGRNQKNPSTHLLLLTQKIPSFFTIQNTTPTHTHTHKRDCRIYFVKYVPI
jgi:hypothetical protein